MEKTDKTLRGDQGNLVMPCQEPQKKTHNKGEIYIFLKYKHNKYIITTFAQ